MKILSLNTLIPPTQPTFSGRVEVHFTPLGTKLLNGYAKKATQRIPAKDRNYKDILPSAVGRSIMTLVQNVSIGLLGKTMLEPEKVEGRERRKFMVIASEDVVGVADKEGCEVYYKDTNVSPEQRKDLRKRLIGVLSSGKVVLTDFSLEPAHYLIQEPNCPITSDADLQIAKQALEKRYGITIPLSIVGHPNILSVANQSPPSELDIAKVLIGYTPKVERNPSEPRSAQEFVQDLCYQATQKSDRDTLNMACALLEKQHDKQKTNPTYRAEIKALCDYAMLWSKKFIQPGRVKNARTENPEAVMAILLYTKLVLYDKAFIEDITGKKFKD